MKITKRQLEGRNHYVVPCVMIVEGTLCGSGGCILYTHEALEESVPHWNGRPVVVYHPSMIGGGTASQPKVFNAQKVGVVFNTRLEGNKLKADAWIDEERAKAVDHRVMECIALNETMELSVGLHMDVIPTKGMARGGSYEYIGQNYRPDHLALLPTGLGACSIEDGAGFIRNTGFTENEPLLSPTF